MEEKEDKRHENSGRKFDQKIKPILVYQYLMRETDENHFASAPTICKYLKKNFNIDAERRSIYRDIHEMNRVLLAYQEDIPLALADELIEEDEENKNIRFRMRKGFYVAQRLYNEEDVCLIAECVHSAKFVDEKRAKRLVSDVLLPLVSKHHAEHIGMHALVKNRVKTSNTTVFYTVNTIRDAIGNGGLSTRKIKFQYLKHVPGDIHHQSKRRQGENYVVTPYTLLIDNGNYYLLGCYEGEEKIRTYRVDRMSKVAILEEHIDDANKFESVDAEKYTQEHFGMFGGDLVQLMLCCDNILLEAMIDRFGKENISYIPVGKSRFKFRIAVYISELFYGWISGYGRKIQILSPQSVRDEYAAYLKKIHEWHSRPTDN